MKKQLCLLVAVLLSMSVLGGYRTFAEAYTQRVSLCDFQPDIKTLLYDDDFNDYNSDGTRSVKSPYNHGYTNCKAFEDDLNGGMAMSLQNSSQYIQFEKPLDSKKLIMSFYTYTKPGAKAGFSVYNNGKKVVDFNAWDTSNRGDISVFGTKVFSAPAGTFKTGKWVNFSMELERVENSDTGGYDVRVNNIYYDNAQINFAAEAPASSTVDWWSDGNCKFTVKTQVAKLFDDVIIYEPSESEGSDIPPDPSIEIIQEPSESNGYSLTINSSIGTSGYVYVDGDGESRRKINYTYENENKTIKPDKFVNGGRGYKLCFEGFKDIGGASLGKISYLVGDGDIVVGGISLTKDEKPYSMITTDTGEVKTNIKTIKKTDATSDPMAFTAIYDGGKLVSISSASTYENGVSENTITVPENLSENAYMTVFVWNSTLKPYAKSKQMKFSTTKEKATLHLVADSIGVTYNTDTVDINAENGRYPQQGMGNYLQGIFKSDTITVKNYSVGGSTTLDYLNNTYDLNQSWKTNCWNYVMESITPGDYVMIVLGINDGGKLTENEFKTNLIKMIKDVKSAGANVIVGSSTFTAWGVTDKTFTPNSGNYYSLAIQAAKENNVPCIDLHTAMQNDLKALCSDSYKTYKDALNEYYLTAELFAAEDPGGTRYYKNPSVAKSGYDVTHLSYKGAKRLCEVIIKNLLKQSSSTLKTYLK